MHEPNPHPPPANESQLPYNCSGASRNSTWRVVTQHRCPAATGRCPVARKSQFHAQSNFIAQQTPPPPPATRSAKRAKPRFAFRPRPPSGIAPRRAKPAYRPPPAPPAPPAPSRLLLAQEPRRRSRLATLRAVCAHHVKHTLLSQTRSNCPWRSPLGIPRLLTDVKRNNPALSNHFQ